jgi:Myb-like DNA-binding domain
VCTVCDRDISKSVKIKCMECPNTVCLCLDCHRNGRTKVGLSHKGGHDYYVIDNLNFPLLMKEWSAKEELQLIQGIMKCGLGNWLEVSGQFVKTKTLTECEEHYYTFYNKSRADFLPYDDDYIISQRFVPSTAAGGLRNSQAGGSESAPWAADEVK